MAQIGFELFLEARVTKKSEPFVYGKIKGDRATLESDPSVEAARRMGRALGSAFPLPAHR